MGYKVGFKDVNDILATLSQEYDIYGPKCFENKGVIQILILFAMIKLVKLKK